MKLRIEVINDLPEDEVLIRCGRIDGTINQIHAYVSSLTAQKLTCYKDTQEYYLSPEEILFFETEGELIHAHTAEDAFRVKYRLYELEQMLPYFFVRASKGVIVNTEKIYSINRNLTSSSRVEFRGTHKQIYVSRHYYGALKEKMSANRR